MRPEGFAQALAALRGDKLEAGLPATQSDLLDTLRNALCSLDSIADERVRPKEALAKEVIETQKAIGQIDLTKSPDEVAKEIGQAREKALHDFRFDVLSDRIQKTDLAPEIQAYLLQTLASNPDPRYRTLISAYLNPLVPTPPKEKR